jgi:hypothetical protein
MGAGHGFEVLRGLCGPPRGDCAGLAEMTAILVIVFTVLNYNAAGMIDGSMMRRANSMTQCHEWQEEYDRAMLEVNNESPPAFKTRWATDCRVMVPALGNRGGV